MLNTLYSAVCAVCSTRIACVCGCECDCVTVGVASMCLYLTFDHRELGDSSCPG